MFWMVTRGNCHIILNTVRPDREAAKRTAYKWLGGDKDRYIVTPLTKDGDRVRIEVTTDI